MALSIGAHTAVSNNLQDTTTGALTTQATGSILVAYAAFLYVNGGFSAITDTIGGSPSGNTWQQVGSELTLASGQHFERVYYVENAAGGANHIFNCAVTGDTVITSFYVLEIIGAATSSSLNGTPARQSDASSPYTSPGITTTENNTILIGFHASEGVGGSFSHTAGNSFTKLDEITDSNNFYPGCSMYRIVSSTGTYNTSVTTNITPNDTGNWILAFKQAGGGGSGPMFRGS